MAEQGFDPAALIGAVQDWAARTFPAAGNDHEDHDAARCQWCPLCQFASVLRGEHPEVTDRMVEAGTALATGLRAFLDSVARAGDRGGDPAGPASEPRVQRIDLGDPDGTGDPDETPDTDETPGEQE